MRVRVSYTVEVDDAFREEINRYYGREGKATREEVEDWFRAYGDSMNDDLSVAAQECEEAEEMYARVREDYPEDSV